MLDPELVKSTIDTAMSTGGEFAEVFVEDRRSMSAVLDDGRIEELTSGRDRGAGVRVISGDTTGFAHTADLSEVGLRRAAEAAAATARTGSSTATVPLNVSEPADSIVLVLPESVAKSRKVALLRAADDAARGVGGAISQVTARYSEGRRRILVANSDGLWSEDDQVRTLFSVSCVASGDTGMQTGRETVGCTVGYELFDSYDVEELARRAGERALTKLRARPAPSGEHAVVIKSGGGGVLFHEACGHGLEADLVRKGASVFKDRVGEQVAIKRADAHRRRHDDQGVGQHRDRRRGPCGTAQRSHRGRHPHRLHVGSPQGARRRQAALGQRP